VISLIIHPADEAKFDVFTTGEDFIQFKTFYQAIDYAVDLPRAFIYDHDSGRFLWDNRPFSSSKLIKDVPKILQLPELPRGCEVTSLAMLLNSQGVNVTKIELADKIKKDLTPYKKRRGKIYYGNPRVGFVGEMKSFNSPGYGVYHEPIFELLDKYVPGMALDISGCRFDNLLYFLSLDIPVWVIINTKFAPLPDSDFITWHTKQGEVKITYSEHAVLLIGYDKSKNLVYFNDPLGGADSAALDVFGQSWEQMGRQAVTVKP
jgi:uncharacterized protein YvpB